MWGPGIIGLGTYHYKYDSWHEGDAPILGFSPRNAAIMLYLSIELEKKKNYCKNPESIKPAKAVSILRNWQRLIPTY